MKKYAVIFGILSCVGCSQELPTQQEFPVLKTLTPVDVNELGATFRAEVVLPGKAPVGSFGFVCGPTPNPTLESGKQVIVNGALNQGQYEQRLNHSLANGLQYRVRAFARYGDKVVYGNEVVFDSQGSELSGWSLVSENDLEGWFYGYGTSNAAGGIIVFQSSHLYQFDPDDGSISDGPSYPEQGNSGTTFCSVNVGDILYFISTISRRLYRFEDDHWTIESTAPFSFGIFGGYYHGLEFGGNVYLLSSYRSTMYNPSLNVWQERARLPAENYGSIGGATLAGKAYVMTFDKKIWEYTPQNDSWILKTTYPGAFKRKIIAFADESKLYFGLSHYDYYEPEDWMDQKLWSFDPIENEWVAIEDFPMPLSPGDMFSFESNNILYVVEGGTSLFRTWSFDPAKAH